MEQGDLFSAQWVWWWGGRHGVWVWWVGWLGAGG